MSNRVWEYKLSPNKAQTLWIEEMLRLTKNLYNTALEERIKFYKETGKSLNLFAQDKGYNKKTCPDIPAQLVDTTLKRLDRSYQNFFRRVKNGEKAGFPRFQSWKRWHSFAFRDSGCGMLKGATWNPTRNISVKVILHRPWEGTPKFTRLVKKADGYYVQLTTELPDVPVKKLTDKSNFVGLDVGLKVFVTDSTGASVPNPRYLKRCLHGLAKAQRKQSKAKKGSRRRHKLNLGIAKIHKKTADRRKDFIHKTAKVYADRYDAVCVEKLQVKNMMSMRSLSRSIGDAAWSMFFSVLQDKVQSLGKTYIEVPPHYTSQKCSGCSEIVQKSLSVRTHVCPFCGYIGDRDHNAARNILKIGLVQSFGEKRAMVLFSDPRSRAAFVPAVVHRYEKRIT